MIVSRLLSCVNKVSLVSQIVIGLILGVLIAYLLPDVAIALGLLGTLFVGALKSVAPVLVFILVIAAISKHRKGASSNIKPILLLYVFGTFLAALVAVIFSFLFPTTLALEVANVELNPPGGIVEVLRTLLINMVDNPVSAIAKANYIGILAWAILLGATIRHASETTIQVFSDLSECISQIVRWIILFAPLGILGLVASTIAKTGFGALLGYAQLLVILVACMLFIALLVNPILVFWKTGRNPYPLVFTCLKESGITAFFTRSSAANIPVNISLCKRLGLSDDTYPISIPLGATINMAGAAVTITILTLAAVHTLGIEVDIITAVLLSVIAAVSACGASGVAGGSLLLIPLACNLFGISNDVAMQVVGVGFIIGVVQDSIETALNSSTDVLFTAASDKKYSRKFS